MPTFVQGRRWDTCSFLKKAPSRAKANPPRILAIGSHLNTQTQDENEGAGLASLDAFSGIQPAPTAPRLSPSHGAFTQETARPQTDAEGLEISQSFTSTSLLIDEIWIAQGTREGARFVGDVEITSGVHDRSGEWRRCLILVGVCLGAACFQPLTAFASTAAESTSFSILQVLKGAIVAKHGTLTYALLFGIVFCETGLVLTPFLPGDSLLFVAGALAGLGKLNMAVVSALFIIAAILGDAVNYAMGSWLGQKAVNANLISKSNIAKTEEFFETYGGKTIVLARFVPIVRTFAPFVAGMSHMEYQRFAAFNIGGALLWTCLFCGAGYFFGNLPFVEKNFSLVVLAIVVISVVPIIYEILAANNHQTNTSSSSSTSSP